MHINHSVVEKQHLPALRSVDEMNKEASRLAGFHGAPHSSIRRGPKLDTRLLVLAISIISWFPSHLFHPCQPGHGVKDQQNMAHLKCRVPQVVVPAVLNYHYSGVEMLLFTLLAQNNNTLEILCYFWSCVHCFISLLLPHFASHPRRWCKCHGNDMLFGIHGIRRCQSFLPLGFALAQPRSEEVHGDQ